MNKPLVYIGICLMTLGLMVELGMHIFLTGMFTLGSIYMGIIMFTKPVY